METNDLMSKAVGAVLAKEMSFSKTVLSFLCAALGGLVELQSLPNFSGNFCAKSNETEEDHISKFGQ